MQTYNVRVTGALEATALIALFTLISGSVQANLLTEIDIEGMGTSSAAQELGIYRVGTAGTTEVTTLGELIGDGDDVGEHHRPGHDHRQCGARGSGRQPAHRDLD